jgi:hypothetical protein
MLRTHHTSLARCAWMAALAALVLCAPSGCGQDESRQPERSRPPGSTAISEREVERLRSLPYASGSSAPENEPAGVIVCDPERACPGYRLFEIPNLGRAELIDRQGQVVHAWRQSQASERWQHVELLASGDLLVVGMEPQAGQAVGPESDSGHFVMKLDAQSRVLWKRPLAAHHDIEVTPDGHLLTLTFYKRLIPSFHPTVETRDDQLTLLDSSGVAVESMSLLDAIQSDPHVFPLESVEPTTLYGQHWMDIFHTNSIEWMHQPQLFAKHPLYGPNNILVCFRHQDRIAIFDWSAHRVVWSWGRGELRGPHDASVLENGHILLLDNGLGRGWSRAIELDPLTGKIVWEYKADPPNAFYSGSKGSAQRLPNGNTLLAESDRGRAIEVDPEGRTVWEFICPHRLNRRMRAAIARIVLYPPEFVAPLLAGPSGPQPAAAR